MFNVYPFPTKLWEHMASTYGCVKLGSTSIISVLMFPRDTLNINDNIIRELLSYISHLITPGAEWSLWRRANFKEEGCQVDNLCSTDTVTLPACYRGGGGLMHLRVQGCLQWQIAEGALHVPGVVLLPKGWDIQRDDSLCGGITWRHPAEDRMRLHLQ